MVDCSSRVEPSPMGATFLVQKTSAKSACILSA
jgi:hypothetical protein